MGTRGLFFVRCRGRYFVYYNHYDSYPEGLGEAIVQEIPQDPGEYQKWLQLMRARFCGLAIQYEERCLPVSVKGDRPESTRTLPERYMKSYLSVDDRLEDHPLQVLTIPDSDIWIEWTYTLDLDREIFTVDHALHFKFTKIPRPHRWMKFISEDVYRRRDFKKFTPKEIIGNVTCVPQFDRAAKDKYQTLGPEVVPARSLLPDSEEVVAHREALFCFIVSLMRERYACMLDKFFPEWDSGHFVFRELAFCLLSIAAGEVGFEHPKSLNRSYKQEGYFLIPETKLQAGQQSLLPRFLHESHAPGVQPGSAPEGTTYWMSNALIHLVTRTDLVDVEEAAVAEVVDFGLNAGKREFYAMVFSILDVILIRVHKNNEDGKVHVQRSPLMALIYFCDKNSRFVNGARSRTFDQSEDATTSPDSDLSSSTEHEEGNEDWEDEESEGGKSYALDVQAEKDEGFRLEELSAAVVKESYEDTDFTFSMMFRFFDAASKEHLANQWSRIVPNEIMTTIMGFSDTRTSQILQKTSSCCRKAGNYKIRLNDAYAIVGVVNRGEGAPAQFLVEDLRTGERITSTVEYSPESYYPRDERNESSMELNPVIGYAGASNPRMTIVDTIHLSFSDLSAPDPEYTEKEEQPRPDRYTYSSGFHDTASKLFEMPTYLYPGSVENAWGQYITVQTRGGENTAFRFVMLRKAEWQCLMPPRYRQLRMDHLYCNGLQALVRHPNDESPAEWEQTINYAVTQLGRTESELHRHYDGYIRGRPIIVAFGTKVKFFYYVYHCDETPAVPPNPSPHSVRIAEACTKPEGRDRLVDLTPGDNPLDMRDPEAREKLEHWLLTFRGDEGFCTEWDPITETRHSIGRKPVDSDPPPVENGDENDAGNEDEPEGEGEEANN